MHVSPRRAASLVVAVASLALAAPAAATTLVLPDGTQRPQPYQSWIDHAHVPTPAGVVTLSLDGCGGMAGCSPEGERTISLSRDWRVSRVLLHELGHVFDDSMPGWVRMRFETITGSHGPWASAASDSPPEEQFAEAYSLCARHTSIRARYYASYMYAPTPAQHRRVCALIRAAGARP